MKLLIGVIGLIGLFAFFFIRPDIQGVESVCFCHGIIHNPVTICTSNQGQINGHTSHIASGMDTLGVCIDNPVMTPTPTLSIPSLTPTPPDIPMPSLIPTPVSEERITQSMPSGDPHVSSTSEVMCPPFDPPILQGAKIKGQSIEFSWWRSQDPGVTKQSLVYGYEKGIPLFGVDVISPDTTSFSISDIDVTRPVWAKIYAFKHVCASESEWFDP